MNISYDYYRVFYFAAIHGSFTRAAALLGLGFMAAVNLHRQKRK